MSGIYICNDLFFFFQFSIFPSFIDPSFTSSDFSLFDVGHTPFFSAFSFLRSALTFQALAAIEETGDTAVNNNNNNQKKKKNKYNLDKMFLKFSLI